MKQKIQSSRSLKRLGMRLRAAFRTNEPQLTMLFVLTSANGIALLRRDAETPCWLVAGALGFWPAVAFLSNLHDPIPGKSHTHSIIPQTSDNNK